MMTLVFIIGALFLLLIIYVVVTLITRIAQAIVKKAYSKAAVSITVLILFICFLYMMYGQMLKLTSEVFDGSNL